MHNLSGVLSYTVDLDDDSATVTYDPRQLTLDQIAASLERGDYPVNEIIPLK